MTNTTNQKDCSATSGELVGEVKKDRVTGIPYIDWKRDHTSLPVGFKLYGARAPQAATPLPGGLDERALPALPEPDDVQGPHGIVDVYYSCTVLDIQRNAFEAGKRAALTQQAAPTRPNE